MKGTIAQTVALVLWGNSALKDMSSFDGTLFYPANSTFNFCEFVKFVHLKREGDHWKEFPCAEDPLSWLKYIHEKEVESLRVSRGPSNRHQTGDLQISDRMLDAFVGGGGRWLLEAVHSTGSDYWEGRWEIGDRDRSDRKIWRVTYGCIAEKAPSSRLGGSVVAEQIKLQLIDNLTKISAFARKQKLDGFAEAFSSAIDRLHESHALKAVFHSDIAPLDLLPESAQQLLAAAQAAWVFGGMGSWNDLGFDGEDQRIYTDLSEELYRLLNDAIVVASNSMAPGSPVLTKKPWWRLWSDA